MQYKNYTSSELQQKRDQYVPQAIGNGNRNIASYARNATITDIEGNEWIDFAGAIGTLNVGHTHPKISAAVKNQVDKFLHPGFNVVMYESYILLAEKLTHLMPGTMAKQAMLFNSGAEAVENAVKVARKYTNKSAVVSFERGFHGRTNLTMGMTSKVKPYKFGFGPFAPEIYQAPYPYMDRKPPQLTEEEYIDAEIQRFRDFFVSFVAPETVACMVLEPVQGEGGFVIPPKKFIKYVEAFCRENHIVLIADEIQTGFGRTGKMFASEHFDLQPDLMTLSKSLAAGLPLSAVVGNKDILASASPGELGGTYAGNPLACEAALNVIEVIEEEDLLQQAEKQGAKIEQALAEVQKKNRHAGSLRRLGAMVAMEIVNDQQEQVPDKQTTQKLIQYANQHGLLLLGAGIDSNVIRFLAPLTISEQELNRGLAILQEAFHSLQ
ncbi:4-aminobutyrate--2-oxoglutarate transaminase [Marinococcus halophilus]|uniref:4-aminobutyrate--2-oxoglutarate transaminase n=1 Tax=Marinococcus halophilus TaxID=1371 RepID=UPI0009A7B049|nr:4-aminobutyrate--2-oxoglutarate transaminase [Marinococcus halophilus]